MTDKELNENLTEVVKNTLNDLNIKPLDKDVLLLLLQKVMLQLIKSRVFQLIESNVDDYIKGEFNKLLLVDDLDGYIGLASIHCDIPLILSEAENEFQKMIIEFYNSVVK